MIEHDLLLIKIKAHAKWMSNRVKGEQRQRDFNRTMMDHIITLTDGYAKNIIGREPTEGEQLAIDLFKEIRYGLEDRFFNGRGTEYAVERL